MSKIISLTVALIFSGSLAREFFTVEEKVTDLQHNRPNVEQYNCRQCLVENDNVSICATYGANLKAGLNWDQEWYDDPDTPGVYDGYYKIT
jgi:hypothetical protein